ncbi:MAG TPA: ATP synthase F1 subunit epsilon [Bacteroidales bacterium]|nr:ATP synthase F1 subunit epsilon [Bacteroidales bacterium]HPS16792.1 ATP synthase F1 subunit epsilon [Bacteroidales bacterium]
MLIEIITPDKKVFSGEVSLAKFPGTNGSFELLNNHAPIISTLTKGKIKIIDSEKKTQFFEINSGVVEVQKNKIIVLAE